MLHWFSQNQMTIYHVMVIAGITWVNITLVKIRAFGVGSRAAKQAIENCSKGGVNCLNSP